MKLLQSPSLLFAALLGVSLVCAAGAFAFKQLRGQRFHDAEMAGRGESALLSMQTRMFFAWAIQPLLHGLLLLELPANALTTLSALLATGAAFAAAAGRLPLAGWLFLAAGACDFFDGRLARAQNTAGRRGAAIDSVIDRYSDAVIMGGLAIYYSDTPLLPVVLIGMTASLMVSYVRARGEGLGVDVRVGFMQRPERVALLGAALVFSPLATLLPNLCDHASPKANPLIGTALLFIALFGTITVAQRFIHVVRALSDAPVSSGGRNRWQLFRATASAFLATGVDFLVVVTLVDAGVSPWLATGAGSLLGALVNFSVNRWWTFGSHAPAIAQAGRYGLVSVTSAGLNSGGVALAMLMFADYRPAWLLVRGLVFLCWNFPLQRDYVYRDRVSSPPDAEQQPSLVEGAGE